MLTGTFFQGRLAWGAPLGFNNAYCLLMRQGQARQLGIGSISQLGQYVRR